MHRARPGSADALAECAFRLACRYSEIGKSRYDRARAEKCPWGRLTVRHSNSKVMKIVDIISMVYTFPIATGLDVQKQQPKMFRLLWTGPSITLRVNSLTVGLERMTAIPARRVCIEVRALPRLEPAMF